MSDVAEILEKLNNVNDLIATAQKNLAKGEVANLAFLEERTNKICEEIVTLPPENAKDMQGPLANMIGNLETLALSLKEFQKDLQEKME